MPSNPTPNPIPAQATEPKKREPVLISYHHFPHYRGAVLRELMESEEFDFYFAGDRSDPIDGTVKTFDGIPPERFIHTPWIKVGNIMLWQRKLLPHLLGRRFKKIVMLGNVNFISNWFFIYITRIFGKRMMLWTHGWRKPPQGIKKLLYWIFFRPAYALLMYEHFAKIIGISQGFKPERLYVVYNSLDYNKQVEARQTVTPEKTEALREKLFPGSNDPIIMLAGRVIERRRYDLAFEAGSILQKQGYPVNFLILGNGPELENYRDLAKRLGVNANFYGACYDENEIALMFSTCDCGLCPGPLGLAVTHGYAYGRPMIASDYAGEQGPEWGSIVPGVNGDLFKYNDPESLASKIRDWTWPNADIPQKVADACREVVEKRYNPRAQRLVIEAALRGEPANDLMLSWQDETPASQDARHALPSPANDN